MLINNEKAEGKERRVVGKERGDRQRRTAVRLERGDRKIKVASFYSGITLMKIISFSVSHS